MTRIDWIKQEDRERLVKQIAHAFRTSTDYLVTGILRKSAIILEIERENKTTVYDQLRCFDYYSRALESICREGEADSIILICYSGRTVQIEID